MTLPDWQQADPLWIAAALSRANARPHGDWYVLGPSTDYARVGPMRAQIAVRELVLWRDDLGLHAAPNACPHLGAPLCDGHVVKGALVCPWHGLRLGAGGHRDWQTFALHDDGVLLWVCLDAKHAMATPPIPVRAVDGIAAVTTFDARCAPADVIANRLDPWHGAHLHPRAFRDLRVVRIDDDDLINVSVTYRVLGAFGVPADITFYASTPRCITMRINSATGRDSTVETHVTPLAPGLSRITELTIASHPHPGFRYAHWFAPLIRRVLAGRSRQLWVDDLTYAERLYATRLSLER